jgi:hypothetical protein
MMTPFRRSVAALLIVCTAGIGMPLPAQAGMVATEAALNVEARDRVAAVLARDDVQAALKARGVSPQDVAARVAAMTDEEAARVAAQLDRLPAGGNALIGAIVLIFLVLLITDILGLTKVFPFTRPIKK